MSLPVPNLDDRSFQDIVDELKRRIGYRCPEWTEHNVSDPGVTLLELFAGMTESLIYRLNQVPEKNFIKFMELLGVTLRPPVAATTDVRFRLIQPLVADVGDQVYELKKLGAGVATLRTEIDDAVEFVLADNLVLGAPKVRAVFTASGDMVTAELSRESGLIQSIDLSKYSGDVEIIEERDAAAAALSAAFQTHADRDTIADLQKALNRLDKAVNDKYFAIFGATPRQDDALYIGFENNVSGHLIELLADGLAVGADRLRENKPLQVWEFFEPRKAVWARITPVRDDLRGFNTPDGSIELPIPYGLQATFVGGVEAFWVRCRYTTQKEDLPQYVGLEDQIDPYTTSPRIRRVQLRTIGGDAVVENSEPILNEVLGESDGLPGQVFKLNYGPALDLDKEERVLHVVEPSDDLNGAPYTVWTSARAADEPLMDFADSGPEDRHFVFDALTGEISFGPTVRCPDGTLKQCGAVPPKGHRIMVPRYRIGGGTGGNVREDSIRVLKSSNPNIASVRNIRPAENGRDRELLEHAKHRLALTLRTRNRAVTAEDFSALAVEGSRENDRPRVSRATCIGPEPGSGSHTVRVLLVPTLLEDDLAPTPERLKVDKEIINAVRDYLDVRKLITTMIEIGQPKYRYISTEMDIVAEQHANPEEVGREVTSRLSRFIHPTLGGYDGRGWPFGQRLTIGDLYAVVSKTPGVAFHLTPPRILTSESSTTDGSRSVPKEIDLKDGVSLGADEMFVTREHLVRVRPWWEAPRS